MTARELYFSSKGQNQYTHEAMYQVDNTYLISLMKDFLEQKSQTEQEQEIENIIMDNLPEELLENKDEII